jgi:hypothetical protein
MTTQLLPIEIMSIYERRGQRVLLPKRMAKCTPDTQTAISKIASDVQAAGGNLYLSDLFRSYDMQLQSHLNWKSGKKKALSPPPGGSMHEAGRAFDLSLDDLGIQLDHFWDIAGKYGVKPIISEPDPRKSEAWHFECRGSNQEVYDYYKSGKASNMTPYKAMAASSILAIGVELDKYQGKYKQAYMQSCLIRLGADIGNIDSIIGGRTKRALSDLGIELKEYETIFSRLEDLLQDKFPNEFRIEVTDDEDWFDYEMPEFLKKKIKGVLIDV